MNLRTGEPSDYWAETLLTSVVIAPLPHFPVGVLTVGVLTVGVLIGGVLIVGVLTIGASTVGVLPVEAMLLSQSITKLPFIQSSETVLRSKGVVILDTEHHLTSHLTNIKIIYKYITR